VNCIDRSLAKLVAMPFQSAPLYLLEKIKKAGCDSSQPFITSNQLS
jgi:hypothetical protein